MIKRKRPSETDMLKSDLYDKNIENFATKLILKEAIDFLKEVYISEDCRKFLWRTSIGDLLKKIDPIWWSKINRLEERKGMLH